MKVEAGGVSVRIDDAAILDAVGLTAEPAAVTGLIGPNGSGKSTFLRCVYRALKPTSGTVHIGQEDVWRTSARRAGLRTAVVAQDHDLDNGYSVLEIVTMGRNPHKGMLDRETGADRKIAEDALARVGMDWAVHRVFATLSGGERQRVLVARALTQEAPVLLLDEPTNHLDIGAQHELLDLVKSLELTTIAALHDLDHATTYCERLVLLHNGRVVSAGTPAEVLTAERVAAVFGVRSAVVPHPLTGRPHFVTASPASADPVPGES